MIQIGSGRSWVAMDWHFVGEDLYVSIIGGETPHIGAAALAHRESGRMDVHTLSVPGHREEALTRFCAEDICRATGRTVLVNCGIHIDQASAQEISLLCDHVHALEQQLLLPSYNPFPSGRGPAARTAGPLPLSFSIFIPAASPGLRSLPGGTIIGIFTTLIFRRFYHGYIGAPYGLY